MSAVVFQAAGLLLSYPDEELLGRLDLIESAVAETRAAGRFAATFAHLRSLPLMELQSWHVQEFDLSRRHALHLTYWTDGDTRRRGEVLAGIKQIYRDSGCSSISTASCPTTCPWCSSSRRWGTPAAVSAS
ncbi:nitrate reductase molybdenum cofactor assembly chaperone [Tessaracoccus defluvii]|uniref:nitrate reductase molybdenum cofactor assembly chaperone n=1 Tax=Tessaracoccus defluvii TaxID=1285901 RepID=UPI001D050DC3|nr:hypothetical protein [Tessaracoccus defluvii]